MATVTITPSAGEFHRESNISFTISADFPYTQNAYSNSVSVYMKRQGSAEQFGYIELNITHLPQTFTFSLYDIPLRSGVSYTHADMQELSVSGSVYNGSTSQGFGATYSIVDYTACKGPTWCALDTMLSKGEGVMLRWNEGTPGTANPIAGYAVFRYEMTGIEDVPTSFDSFEYVGGTEETSMLVYPPDTYGHAYTYFVWAYGQNYQENSEEEGCTCQNVLIRDHAPLEGFTDATLTPGSSPIKALHMTELQDRVNTLRTFYLFDKYNFTKITAGVTSLAGWTSHVNEIRTAIEEVCAATGKTHETWITFNVNCPRADVIQQLRDVILAL